jgi:hypothetical protein
MHRHFPQQHTESLDQMLARARATRRDSIVRLDKYQRQLLETFMDQWNAHRATLGKKPKTANEALTEGLETLIAMLGQE